MSKEYKLISVLFIALIIYICFGYMKNHHVKQLKTRVETYQRFAESAESEVRMVDAELELARFEAEMQKKRADQALKDCQGVD